MIRPHCSFWVKRRPASLRQVISHSKRMNPRRRESSYFANCFNRQFFVVKKILELFHRNFVFSHCKDLIRCFVQVNRASLTYS
jgi:hypothetical protein